MTASNEPLLENATPEVPARDRGLDERVVLGTYVDEGGNRPFGRLRRALNGGRERHRGQELGEAIRACLDYPGAGRIYDLPLYDDSDEVERNQHEIGRFVTLETRDGTIVRVYKRYSLSATGGGFTEIEWCDPSGRFIWLAMSQENGMHPFVARGRKRLSPEEVDHWLRYNSDPAKSSKAFYDTGVAEVLKPADYTKLAKILQRGRIHTYDTESKASDMTRAEYDRLEREAYGSAQREASDEAIYQGFLVAAREVETVSRRRLPISRHLDEAMYRRFLLASDMTWAEYDRAQREASEEAMYQGFLLADGQSGNWTFFPVFEWPAADQ